MEHVLLHLVGLKRPYCSNQEAGVVPYLMRTITLMSGDYPTLVDGAGNLHVDLRDGRDCRTLFVAHTDTVHGAGGINEFTQGARKLTAKGAPLGADDAAGIAILMSMIVSRVPGYYIFTRGEEVGGIGSQYLADEWPDLLSQFDRAIAFDRKGTTDVVTHQRGSACCSTEFADALSDALNDAGLLTMPTSGVYTDTAEFVDIIPECTNISCGYYLEHTDKEWLDLEHWRKLCDVACELRWDDLPTVRDPKDEPDIPAWVYGNRVPAKAADLYTSIDFQLEDEPRPEPDDNDESDPFHIGRCS